MVAEGAKVAEHSGDNVTLDVSKDEFGHVRLGGIGKLLAKEIEKRMDSRARAVVLGHVQRGGSRRRSIACWERATDRARSTWCIAATRKMAALRGNETAGDSDRGSTVAATVK